MAVKCCDRTLKGLKDGTRDFLEQGVEVLLLIEVLVLKALS